MSILFVSSEIYPYAKSGGLADVAHSLPEAVRKREEVYTIMPLYKIVDREKFNIVSSGLKFEYWLNGVCYTFELFKREENKFELFLYNDILCERDDLYGDSYGGYQDNALRFGLFAYGVIESILRLKLDIKIIHINDWQTSLIALLAKENYSLKQKIVLTIHNLAYQGIFDKSIMDILELNWEKTFKYDRFEYYDGVNFLKAGIFYSDIITTVSPTYAKEIQTPQFGHGLDTLLRDNSYKLKGILNGISYDIFDPKRDEAIYKKFNIRDYKYKAKNREMLLEELGMDKSDFEKPLFIFIGRFTHQKGVDLLIESLHLFKDFEANMVILGSGEEYYNNIFRNLKNSYKNIHIEIGYDEVLSRKMYAGADFLIMPSLFEPCGLNQMIAMKYGTMPIVAKIGGLKDTVSDFTDVNEEYQGGVGITFEEHNLFWFLHTLSKAFSLYSNQKKFKQICKKNMKVDYSWRESAQKYIEIYKNL